jgi:hypothetical protein
MKREPLKWTGIALALLAVSACTESDGVTPGQPLEVASSEVGAWLFEIELESPNLRFGLLLRHGGSFAYLHEWRDNPGPFCESAHARGTYTLEGRTLTQVGPGWEQPISVDFVVDGNRAMLTIPGEPPIALSRAELEIEGTCPRSYGEVLE